jgi:hypothetical protein
LPAGYLNLLFNMTQVRQMACKDYNCRSTSDDLTPKTEQSEQTSSLAETVRFGERCLDTEDFFEWGYLDH